MTPDPKLVEAVARAIARSDGWDIGSNHDGNDWSRVPTPAYRTFHQQAAAALAAIPASGEWWIAPWLPREAMVQAAAKQPQQMSLVKLWEDMRDAHLKDTGTDK